MVLHTTSLFNFFLFILFHKPIARSQDSCLNQFALTRDVKVNSVNSLIYEIIVFTRERTSLYTEYETRDVPDAMRLRTVATEMGTQHTIHLLRLYENSEYNFYIYSTKQQFTECIFHDTVITGEAPSEILARRKPTITGENSFGFMINVMNRPGEYWYALDKKGRIVWYLEKPTIEPEQAFVVMQNHDVIVHTFKDGISSILQFSPWGSDVTVVKTGCETGKMHHAIADQNKILTVGRSRHKIDGLQNEQVSEAVVQIDIISNSYKVLFDCIDYIDPIQERSPTTARPSLPDFFTCISPDNEDVLVDDWLHVNGLSIYNSTILLSVWSFDTLYAFRQAPNKQWDLDWKIGAEISDFTFLRRKDKFYGQHAAELLPTGNILMFDNGLNRPREEGGTFSRGLELELDFDKMTAKTVWEFSLELEDGELCASRTRGKIERLKNGNTLVFFSGCAQDGRGYLVEVDNFGDVVSKIGQEIGTKLLYDYFQVSSINGEIEVQTPDPDGSSPTSDGPSPTSDELLLPVSPTFNPVDLPPVIVPYPLPPVIVPHPAFITPPPVPSPSSEGVASTLIPKQPPPVSSPVKPYLLVPGPEMLPKRVGHFGRGQMTIGKFEEKK